MNIVEKLTLALGRPQTLRQIVRGDRLLAAVGRWRHQGAQVDLGETDTIHCVFNVSGGQRVTLRCGDQETRRVVRAGSFGVVTLQNATRVIVSGHADTVQIIISQALIQELGRSVVPPVFSPRFEVDEPRLRAAAVHALVALAQSRQEGHAALDGVVRQVALLFGQAAAARSSSLPVRGGLSPAARRRVHALMEERLRIEGCSPLALGELARAANLSIHHFVKAFRQTEGRTPYASALARRVDLALGLLLRPAARVDQVGEQTGFSSPSHFVSVFRQHLGVTPGALRDAAAAGR